MTDIKIMDLLFTEARFNILSGTYPCDKDLVLKLASILLLMEYGSYNETEHTPEFFK